MWPSLALPTEYIWFSAFQAHGRIASPIRSEVRGGLETYFGRRTGVEVTSVSGLMNPCTKVLANVAAQSQSFSLPQSLSRRDVSRRPVEDRWVGKK